MARNLVRRTAWVVLVASGVVLWARPAASPPWVLAALATIFGPLTFCWRSARGTAARPAIAWAAAAVVLAMLGQAVGPGESPEDGRPGAGQATYLASLATLASLTTVLNARRPGGGAWAFLMVLLVLVFLIPWFEGAGLAGTGTALDRLRLEMPWSLFFGLLILTGATNYLPTRHGPAAIAAAAGLGLELAALVRADWPDETRAWVWSASPWFLAVAAWLAEATASRRAASGSGLERLWLWFRDGWGVVWGLRVLERFNRTAEALGWPIRLAWSGVVAVEPGTAAVVPDAAEATLRGLLRRFADEDRLAEAARPGGPT